MLNYNLRALHAPTRCIRAYTRWPHRRICLTIHHAYVHRTMVQGGTSVPFRHVVFVHFTDSSALTTQSLMVTRAHVCCTLILVTYPFLIIGLATALGATGRLAPTSSMLPHFGTDLLGWHLFPIGRPLDSWLELTGCCHSTRLRLCSPRPWVLSIFICLYSSSRLTSRTETIGRTTVAVAQVSR